MSYSITYSLSPVRQQGLNEAMDIFVEVKYPDNLPVIGKTVSLKLVKPTSFKIKNIKSTATYSGLIGDIINPNSQNGCQWDSVYIPEKIIETTSEIKDFCISKVNKIYPLLPDCLQVEPDYKIKGIKGNKNLITQNGDYVISAEKTIYWIHSSFANLIQKYEIKEAILDISLNEKDELYILTANYIFTLSKGILKEFPLQNKGSLKIHVYQGKVFLVDNKDCITLRGSAVIDGFSLLQEEDIDSFSAFQQYLIYTSKTSNKIYIFNIQDKQVKELDLQLSLPIKNIKLDSFSNIYFSIGNLIFKIKSTTSKPNIDLIFENELVLESFLINTSSPEKLRVIAFDSKKEWVVWEEYTDLELKDYIIPVQNKVLGLRFEWDGANPRIFNKIKDFYIQGSTNFAQITDQILLTDKDGQAKFTYVARKISFPEKFVAIVR